MQSACDNCGKEFLVVWKNQKFCSRKCSAQKNNKERRTSEETKKKISVRLKAYCRLHPHPSHFYNCEKCGKDFNTTIRIRKNHPIHCVSCRRKVPLLKKGVTSLAEVSSRTAMKIMKRLGVGCFNCGWALCACDLHHINPKKNGGSDDHGNLTYLCPNCHRMAYYGLLTTFVSLKERIGDRWKEFYGRSKLYLKGSVPAASL
jgi:hypothetical protein